MAPFPCFIELLFPQGFGTLYSPQQMGGYYAAVQKFKKAA